MLQQHALIIRKHPDGFNYVPFDKMADGSEHPSKPVYLAHLIETGHAIEPMADGHIKLLSGPHAAK